MNEIISRNELTVEEHVQRIKLCLNRTRQSIFDTVISIKECKEQLGNEVFQKDVSEMLGMSPSTLNRWLSIGNSEFILSHQSDLPHTFTSLYNITQLEKRYLEYYPKDGRSPANLDYFISSYEAYSFEEIREIFSEMVCQGFRISEHAPHLGQAWFVWFIFKIFDQDRDGYLSYREMHELLTIGKPDLFELMRGDIAPLSEWAKSAIKSKKNNA